MVSKKLFPQFHAANKILWKQTLFLPFENRLCYGSLPLIKEGERWQAKKSSLGPVRSGPVQSLPTHQVLTDSTGADLQVVPQEEQGQEEGQHVELPVPDCHHEHLQAGGRGQRSHIREGLFMKAQELKDISRSSRIPAS